MAHRSDWAIGSLVEVFCVHICSIFYQKFDHFRVATFSSKMQGRFHSEALSKVRACPVAHQKLSNPLVASFGCEIHGGPAKRQPLTTVTIDRCPRGQKQPNNVDISLEDRVTKRRPRTVPSCSKKIYSTVDGIVENIQTPER